MTDVDTIFNDPDWMNTYLDGCILGKLGHMPPPRGGEYGVSRLPLYLSMTGKATMAMGKSCPSIHRNCGRSNRCCCEYFPCTWYVYDGLGYLEVASI